MKIDEVHLHAVDKAAARSATEQLTEMDEV
jgi:hypothetical protein